MVASPAMDARDAVTWIGHSTALATLGGESVLIDPLGRRRTRRLEYQAVLITHAHVDHLNRWTLAKLDKSVDLYVPKGAEPLVRDFGFARVVEVEPGDQLAIGSLEVTCVKTRHENGRWRKGDRPICSGYVISRGGATIYHAGDIDMSDYELFDSVAREHDIDTALLPIGGMLPVWYYRARKGSIDRGVHIDPDTALRIFEQLGAKNFIPVHWGTVNLRLGGLHGPKRRLVKIATEAGLLERVSILAHGESLRVCPAPPTNPDET